ncbi:MULTISPECIES: aldehyde dehydrogenase [unclassified Chelatococcus]|uniref:aldehyde dehydrogenase n=1 Tax=unclassified Chelatococcus TaxID=2638111 RepID=UPI001BCFC698|nr:MULTISPECIES: aldehyde dehydrogenase [unclassified Chelatococcus]CAH1649713.1 2-hydroxymuconic semialdehyde dehydrogenase [Hyphomicrobiales bacterium]MBS7743406.1 aldehyde dehydrogenase [Chelatococcus sp. HY11]MBX3541476.1 aldehyde dehydrogenase [Chelatococcus sp.]MCO5074630.1 aldehyde dehydrogenase [Chelatococcus sp.]CAH1692144.1 2-hydroxymuconic semialdehyde dehydrogenase [Hyphomicrobiales bacterium]
MNAIAPITLPTTEVTSLIDGRILPASGHRIPVYYPATGMQIAELVEADVTEVDLAVRAARRVFDDGAWARLSVDKRQEILLAINTTILDHAEELARLECLNLGVSMRELRERQIKRAAYNFRFFAEYIGQTKGDVYDQSVGYRSLVVREPVGVAALIAPWNAPTALASMKVAAAIAFGNTCVLKPSEQTPLALRRFVELLHEAGLPPGVVNIVNGRGPVTGEALVKHSGVDRVSFTGGTETGRHIMALAAQRLKPCTLELGGKSANIVFASADIDRALDAALVSIYSNNGQQCLAGSRILLERSIADDFIARFVERARKIRIGDPMFDATELGPLASAAHRDRVLSFADIARGEGAEVLTGGVAPAMEGDLAGGYFVEPTAVLAPSNSARVCQDEIFGPFAAFLTFDSYGEAMQMANDTTFGLVSYLWSDHLPTVEAATRDLKSGVVWVNTTMTRELRAPFGGYKDSGVGREGGQASEQFYTEIKTVTVPTAPITVKKIGMKA